MSRAWLAVSAAVVFVAALLVSAAAAAAAAVPLPDSMAAAGDSITQAFDVDEAGIFQSNPAYSWATGTNKSVDSEYQRILAANPAIKGHVYNLAVPGDLMSSLDGQVKTAASHHVQYLTVEIGADDLCPNSPINSIADMTPTATFQSEYHQALAAFTAADPAAHIFVASIPNIYEVWQLNNTNWVAELTWSTLPWCYTMLPVWVTSAQRQQVVQREQAYNKVLGTVCAEFSHCRFDNDAVYNVKLTSADVSPVDFFHPSITGQAKLASVAWSAGFWPQKA